MRNKYGMTNFNPPTWEEVLDYTILRKYPYWIYKLPHRETKLSTQFTKLEHIQQ